MSARRAAGKRVSLAEAARVVAEWKASGERVVRANGVFDLIHVGHARYLPAAGELGDRLVVAINDDAATAALKGPGRPVVPADDRAALVAALRAVDLVVVFDGPTADRVIETLRPDVHAKGTDYRVDTVPEKDTVRRAGGVTAIAGDPKDHSSKGLVERIRDLGREAP